MEGTEPGALYRQCTVSEAARNAAGAVPSQTAARKAARSEAAASVARAAAGRSLSVTDTDTCSGLGATVRPRMGQHPLRTCAKRP